MEKQDQDLLRQVATRFAAELGLPEDRISEEALRDLAAMIDAAQETRWEGTGQYEGGTPSRPGVIGFAIPPRELMRPVKSIKWSNFTIDPTVAGYTTLALLFGGSVIATGLAASALPVTLPGFALGLAFAVYKAFEKHISYEEAALLHAMQVRANFHRVVSREEALSLGSVLVSEYGYPKGSNSNEIETILIKLIAVKAIRETTEGYRLLESVPYWRGRPQ